MAAVSHWTSQGLQFPAGCRRCRQHTKGRDLLSLCSPGASAASGECAAKRRAPGHATLASACTCTGACKSLVAALSCFSNAELPVPLLRPAGNAGFGFVPDGEANISRAGWASPGQDHSPDSDELTNDGVAPPVNVPGPLAKRFCSFCKLYNHTDDTCKWLLHPERKRPKRCSRCERIGHNANRCRS